MVGEERVWIHKLGLGLGKVSADNGGHSRLRNGVCNECFVLFIFEQRIIL